MRWLVGLGFVVFAASPAFAKSSNPAFLGVGMSDIQTATGVACGIQSITKDSGADAAGLRPGDEFVTVEGKPIGNCTALVDEIQGRESCETVKIEVRRGAANTTVTAKLCSRADVMRQRVVGQKLPITSLVRVEDEATTGIVSKGKTTIVGWFDQEKCHGCEAVFGKLERWARTKASKSSPIAVLAATTAARGKSINETAVDLKSYQTKLDVPLLVADGTTYADFALGDGERIHFMVIDCRGVVQYATPLAPDADDNAAVLDEIFAATEQATRRVR